MSGASGRHVTRACPLAGWEKVLPVGQRSLTWQVLRLRPQEAQGSFSLSELQLHRRAHPPSPPSASTDHDL